jgi:hypothetical protein
MESKPGKPTKEQCIQMLGSEKKKTRKYIPQQACHLPPMVYRRHTTYDGNINQAEVYPTKKKR